MSVSIILLAVVAAQSSGEGCDAGYHGTLSITWPNRPTTNIVGILDPFSFGDTGKFTYFTVNGVDYTVQDTNAVIVTNDATCAFHVTFNGDPLFTGGFES